jgi:protein-disulfide isomerase
MNCQVRWSVRITGLVLPLLFLVACATAPVPVEQVQAPTASPTTTPTPDAVPAATTATETLSSESTAESAQLSEEVVEAEAQDWAVTATVDGDLYVLGNPDAPIRFIDYSDFL